MTYNWETMDIRFAGMKDEDIASFEEVVTVTRPFKLDLTFEDGYANILPRPGEDIFVFITNISYLNSSNSNFRSEVLKAFNCDKNTEFKGIRFVFNFAEVTITEQDVSKNDIYAAWTKARDAYNEKIGMPKAI